MRVYIIINPFVERNFMEMGMKILLDGTILNINVKFF